MEASSIWRVVTPQQKHRLAICPWSMASFSHLVFQTTSSKHYDSFHRGTRLPYSHKKTRLPKSHPHTKYSTISTNHQRPSERPHLALQISLLLSLSKQHATLHFRAFLTQPHLTNSARTTPIPSLHELTALFDVLPELPPPPPRQRRPPPGDKATTPAIPPKPAPITAAPAPKSASASMLRRIFPWMFDEQPDPTQPLPRKPNPFMLIKAAKKNVVIAAVDAGSISFFRFGQGAFDEFPVL